MLDLNSDCRDFILCARDFRSLGAMNNQRLIYLAHVMLCSAAPKLLLMLTLSVIERGLSETELLLYDMVSSILAEMVSNLALKSVLRIFRAIRIFLLTGTC